MLGCEIRIDFQTPWSLWGQQKSAHVPSLAGPGALPIVPGRCLCRLNGERYWFDQTRRIGIWKKLMTQEKNSAAIATFSIQFFRSPVSWGLWWHDRSSKRKWHHSAWWTLPRPGGSLLESGIRVTSESNLSTLSGKMTRLGCGHDIIQSKKYICIIYSSLRTSTLELPGMVLVLRLETIIWVEAISKRMHFVLYRIQPKEKISIEPILCRTKGTPKDLNRIEDQDVVGCIYRPSLYSNLYTVPASKTPKIIRLASVRAALLVELRRKTTPFQHFFTNYKDMSSSKQCQLHPGPLGLGHWIWEEMNVWCKIQRRDKLFDLSSSLCASNNLFERGSRPIPVQERECLLWTTPNKLFLRAPFFNGVT